MVKGAYDLEQLIAADGVQSLREPPCLDRELIGGDGLGFLKKPRQLSGPWLAGQRLKVPKLVDILVALVSDCLGLFQGRRTKNVHRHAR